MKSNAKVLELLRTIKQNIGEVTQLLDEMKVVEVVGNNELVMTDAFEESVFGINEVVEEVKSVTDGKDGKLDLLVEKAKTLSMQFFEQRPKFKKYEGEKIVVGYRNVERKEIVNINAVDPQFVKAEYKPNTEAIDAYREATVSEKDPQGKLPKGIDVKRYSYITFKNIKEDE